MTTEKSEKSNVNLNFDTVRTGDVLLMNRKCAAMKNPLAAGLCFLTKTENRFDHVAMLVKVDEGQMKSFPETAKKSQRASPSGTYVLETNMGGVTLYAAEDRVARSSANEMAVLRVERAPQAERNPGILECVERVYATPYQDDVLKILPSVFSPPDKMDRIAAANKMHRLDHEMAALGELARRDAGVAGACEALGRAYAEAYAALASMYFPHLSRLPTGRVVWSHPHLWIDGQNESDAMVCTELIGNLWRRAGWTHGYVPASSLRPFDMLDPDRFLFVAGAARLGKLYPVKWNARTAAHWADLRVPERGTLAAPGAAPNTAAERLAFLNEMRDAHGLQPLGRLAEVPLRGGAVVPAAWLVQSAPYADVVEGLPFRCLTAAGLFATAGFAVAPLTVRRLENQAGLLMLRGSMWSLAAGLWGCAMAFGAVQGAAVAALLLAFAAPPGELGAMADRAQGGVVDARHPYYTAAAAVAAAAVVAQAATTPLRNRVLAHHFGPPRAGPVPLRVLLRGVAWAPAAVLLPLPGFWLGWYESAGAFIVPTASTVYRPRPELLRDPRWPHYRRDAMVGACCATMALDFLLYGGDTRSKRRLVRTLYAGHKSPIYGRRLWAGYRYRFAENAIIMAVTASVLSFYELL